MIFKILSLCVIFMGIEKPQFILSYQREVILTRIKISFNLVAYYI